MKNDANEKNVIINPKKNKNTQIGNTIIIHYLSL